MRFTVDDKAYDYDDATMTFAEGRAIEKVTGRTFGEIGELAKTGSLSAIQALVWVAMKRTEPTLKFSDLDDRAISAFTFDDPEPEPGDPTDPTDGEG